MRCVQEGETQDSTGNTGSTGSEHGNMHRLGKGQDTRDYYIMNIGKGSGLSNNRVRVRKLGSGILGGCVGVTIVDAVTQN